MERPGTRLHLTDLVHAGMMTMQRPRTVARLVAALACAVAALPALACGLEDPSSIAMQRGVLNLAYPQSLYVGTAVWQAQAAGKLPRDPLAQQGDLTPEARAALRMLRASGLLRQFSAKLAERAAAPRAPLAVVLLGPVMWNRFEFDGPAVRPMLHATGPRAGDVVVVTDTAVIEAVGAGTLTLAEALQDGLLRLYGTASEVEAVQRWLAGGSDG
jgi:hypothetical protein